MGARRGAVIAGAMWKEGRRNMQAISRLTLLCSLRNAVRSLLLLFALACERM